MERKNKSRLTSILLLASIYFVSEISAASLRNEAGVTEIADANAQFALDLFRKCSLQGKNLFFSPFSISAALALTQLGARGDTANQMASTLRWSSSKAPVSGYGNYISILDDQAANNKSLYTLATAERIYISNKLTLRPEFSAAARQNFRADAQSANFVGDSEGERKRINDWVAIQTRNKIQNLLAQGTVSASTALLLVQAIYFKGSWLYTFDDKKTSDRLFHAPQEDVKVKMMTQRRQFNYVSNDRLGYSAVQLPYASINGSKNFDLSMVFVLPDLHTNLDQLINKLTPQEFKNLHASLYSTEVNLEIPRFNLESSLGLKDVLINLGMAKAFSNGADFSGMIVEDQPLHISDVIHKAVVQVNEQGAEAAAATAVIIKHTSAVISRPEFVDFIADRPFFFYIIDERADVILFMGKHVTPQ